MQYIHRICVNATEHRLCICLSKVHYFRRGSTFITIRFCIACNFFLYYFIFNNLLRASQDAFALVLKVFLNHCYFYFHERKVLHITITQNLVMRSSCLQILYVCACHRDPSMYMAYGPRGRFENQIVPENLS